MTPGLPFLFKKGNYVNYDQILLFYDMIRFFCRFRCDQHIRLRDGANDGRIGETKLGENKHFLETQ